MHCVEVTSNGCHFLISSMPTMIGKLKSADQFARENPGWTLPNPLEARIIRNNLVPINLMLNEHCIPLIDRECQLWTDQYWISDCPFTVETAKVVSLLSGQIYESGCYSRKEFRLIKRLD